MAILEPQGLQQSCWPLMLNILLDDNPKRGHMIGHLNFSFVSTISLIFFRSQKNLQLLRKNGGCMMCLLGMSYTRYFTRDYCGMRRRAQTQTFMFPSIVNFLVLSSKMLSRNWCNSPSSCCSSPYLEWLTEGWIVLFIKSTHHACINFNSFNVKS